MAAQKEFSETVIPTTSCMKYLNLLTSYIDYTY